jgi:hypothetical protein
LILKFQKVPNIKKHAKKLVMHLQVAMFQTCVHQQTTTQLTSRKKIKLVITSWIFHIIGGNRFLNSHNLARLLFLLATKVCVTSMLQEKLADLGIVKNSIF